MREPRTVAEGVEDTADRLQLGLNVVITAPANNKRGAHAMSNKGQMLQDPFLNTLRKEHVQVSIYLVNGIKLQGQIESFDQYVVLLKNTVTQMVYKHAISTVVPARSVAMPHHAPAADADT